MIEKYYILKTTAGAKGKDYWEQFIKEGVISIGWENVKIDPMHLPKKEKLKTDLIRCYDAPRAASKILKFLNIDEGDIIVICSGYPPNSNEDVFLYGFAKADKKKKWDASSSWWKLKIKADIQIVEKRISVNILRDTFMKDSMLEAIHKVDRDVFLQFISLINEEYDIKFNL